MIFSSLDFFIFAFILFPLYFLLKNYRLQKLLLLLASYIFYGAWNPYYLILIIFSTLLDYYCGEKISSGARKKYYLLLSLFGNLGLLAYFKYFNFFIQESYQILNYLNITNAKYFYLDIVLPVGISFYTFQTLSYTIDIYYGKIKAQKSLSDFALFVAFFPQLVAGPIVRAADFLPQLSQKKSIDKLRIVEGIHFFLMGYIKKVVIADRLSMFVDLYFDYYSGYGSLTTWYALVCYSIQIYCDFSGYSDMAIGIAKVLGFDLPENFNMPYIAKNPADFWRRWHISLSTWLRDYLYIPLGGNRQGSFKRWRNLMLTMILGGLWHGANITFIIWGILHGIYLILHRIIVHNQNILFLKPIIQIFCYKNILNRFLTYLLILIAWVFFRSQSLAQAKEILKIMFNWNTSLNFEYFPQGYIIIMAVIFSHFFASKKSPHQWIINLSPFKKTLTYACIYMIIVLFGDVDANPFIYFQF
jgi:alginate O-acetyltransferase complex protein AlgI